MYDFFLQSVVFISLGIVVYLMARALPRAREEVNQPVAGISQKVKDMVSRIPLSKLDASLNGTLSKFLRKLRVIVLKLDNFIHDRLNKLNKSSGNGKISAGVIENPKSTDSSGENTPQL
ncbi:MAG TPA: hypothetical protein VJB92_02625 [Candidatus Paceibacterota bacterium]